MEKMKIEYKKFKQMNFADKRWYIWEYYKIHIAVIIAVCLLIAHLINLRLNPRPTIYLYTAWVGVEATPWQLEDLSEALGIITNENEEVGITDYSPTDNPTINDALSTRFTALLMRNDIDILIGTEEWVTRLAEAKYFQPPDEVRDYLYEINPQIRLQERMLSAQNDYIGVSLENSPLLEKLGFDTSDIYLCIMVNTENLYEIAQLLEVLLDDTTEIE